MSETDIKIRPFESWDEYLAAEELQRSIWQMPDWRDSVPANLLIVVHKNGGILLGAFDKAKMVGFVFSLVGFDPKNGPVRMKHCSHMLAVMPEYQSRQIGSRLKFAQRDIALAQHINLITWTYDPLLALNANLNLVRLGAIARQYIPDAYGQMSDGLNAGIASDRFQAEWWLDTPRVCSRADRAANIEASDWDELVRAGAQEIYNIGMDERGLPHIERAQEPSADTLIAEIPARMSMVKVTAPDLAREWRSCTRGFFTQAFAAGYVADDFMFVERGQHRRAAYVLRRAPAATGLPQ